MPEKKESTSKEVEPGKFYALKGEALLALAQLLEELPFKVANPAFNILGSAAELKHPEPDAEKKVAKKADKDEAAAMLQHKTK